MAKLENIKAVLLDKDGVFVDFHKLWMRIIAYRAQKIAEICSSKWETMDNLRRICIRAMGVDEDDETIDPHSPIAMPFDLVRNTLTTATYLTVNELNPSFTWKQAHDVVEEAMTDVKNELSYIEMAEEIPGTAAKIQEIAAMDFDIIGFTSDTHENTDEVLKKLGINKCFKHMQAGEYKDAELYKKVCAELKLDPSETLMVSDAPNDLKAAREAGAYAVGVLSGIVRKGDDLSPMKAYADEIIDSLADLDLSKIGSGKKKVMK